MAGLLEQLSKGLFGLAPIPAPNGVFGQALDSAAQWGRGVQDKAANIQSTLADLIRNPSNALPNIPPEALANLLQQPVTPEQKQNIARKALDFGMEFGPLIVAPRVASLLATTRSLPNSPEFAEAVSNTKGARITGDGLLMNVSRNQRPEQALTDSVRGGVFYLPEGAAQAKHYSTGKNGYGGSEKIAGETQFNNPVFVKGATGGKAPESAYDQLIGKGSYQNMRNDALKVYGGYGASMSQKAELAEQFLAKYAPELSGMGEHIVKNSGQGNQLAYALQEAAVGSAVRNAGHDAVLGYSQGRNGNGKFISEIFDVREKSYPDKFGTETRIWDNFKK